MIDLEVEERTTAELTPEMIRAQLETLVHDDVFRSSKRSVAFLRYVVEQTLHGSADQIKERTIGVEVFDREPSYDTNLDHIVRTAATELRKRLAIYYGDEKHRSELRMVLIPGSYIPRFSLPEHIPLPEPPLLIEPLFASPEEPHPAIAAHAEPQESTHRWAYLAVCLLLLCAGLGSSLAHRPTAQDLFWKPVLDTPGPILLAIGDVPNGPPTVAAGDNDASSMPVLGSQLAHTVPFADAVTMARVVGTLESHGKKVVIRKENASSFSDLREGPVVLIGAFNNEWSLRLTRKLRYSLAFDPEKHLIYIKDARTPGLRNWSWGTNQPRDQVGGPHSPVLEDYALISRIRNSETGHVVIVIGGLFTYGTQSAGEFLTDPRLMQTIARAATLDPAHPNLQIVIGTTVTDQTPGPPRVLAVSVE